MPRIDEMDEDTLVGYARTLGLIPIYGEPIESLRLRINAAIGFAGSNSGRFDFRLMRAQVATQTGRVSSSQPNMKQIPGRTKREGLPPESRLRQAMEERWRWEEEAKRDPWERRVEKILLE